MFDNNFLIKVKVIKVNANGVFLRKGEFGTKAGPTSLTTRQEFNRPNMLAKSLAKNMSVSIPCQSNPHVFSIFLNCEFNILKDTYCILQR